MSLKENVMRESRVKDRSPNNMRKITNWVNQIAHKIPVINKLEKKLGMLQGLDPVMETIVHDLNSVTDFRFMKALNAKWDYKNGARFGKINSGHQSDSSDDDLSH
jgi:hypothetical protein